MSTMPPPPDFPPPTPPLPPVPPKKSRTNWIIIGSATAVIAAIVATGIVVAQSSDGGSEGATADTSESATPVEDTVTAEEEPEPTPEDTGPDVFTLNDTVEYETGVEVSLSKFTRGVSSEWASPESTPYVKFTVKLVNGGTKTLDATLLSVNCSYGTDGQSSESVFDSEKGLDGGPSTRILAGKSLNVVWGCELPKGESALQVEVAPDFESETAIFTGTVK
ncbi:hypothetical protein ACFWM5_01375 [Streptomyces bobili]|uniref:hypothetical protein n=1 Tax=Streptomyces bobili TaxID=67280 RepID=UPI00364E2F3F